MGSCASAPAHDVHKGRMQSPTGDGKCVSTEAHHTHGEHPDEDAGMHLATFDSDEEEVEGSEEGSEGEGPSPRPNQPISSGDGRAGNRRSSHNQGQLVSFPEMEAGTLDESGVHQRANAIRSPTSILLKPSSAGNATTSSSSNNDTSLSGGPAEWRERRRARSGGEDRGGSGRFSSHGSNGSSGSRPTPLTRFLNVDDHADARLRTDELDEREEAFARVQALVVRMNRPAAMEGAAKRRPDSPAREYSNNYSAIHGGET